METSAIDDPYPLYLAIGSFFTGEFLYYSFNGLLIVALLVMSFIASGSEVAFFSLDTETIKKSKSGDSGDRLVYELISKPKRLLANILILNNFINVSMVLITTVMVWHAVGSDESDAGVIALTTTGLSLVIVFFGEIIPKVFARQNNLKFAKFSGRILKASEFLFTPLSWLLMSWSNIIESRIQRKGYQISADEIYHILELTEKSTSKEEKDILRGIVNFSSLTVKQVMRSRMDITAFELEMDFHELMDSINKNNYSRIPVFNDTIDKIEGILYVKDLLPHIEKDEHFKWQELLRPAYFVPELKKIDGLLKEFQEKRVHMAIIVDEYGGTSGLITLEDIIEEIVGEIKDEYDDEEIAFKEIDSNTFIFEGKTSLNDFAKVLDIDINDFEPLKGESESLGGLLLEINHKLPNVGQEIAVNNLNFTINSVDKKRIKRVRVKRTQMTKSDKN
ncbi:gliding motility-associated protein GldE [Persicobacter sp. CCB-QB2]|uniref:gliding motility-associated protein GldE n=1 Tax=Persicobacter sp. CCB-QB2 TaxID=1561025 RepID=UPI000A588290|nr:gliding motility-associated protein GldE [Persicobacter sp. CCB-QB2]